MTYLSVCSGIEAATQAWHPLKWQPFAFAEVDGFPSAVLAHHYPHVPNLGDMTRFQEWPDAALDILVGGTPCQSFSVAGLRAGLDDPRGSLMLVYLAVARRYRPRWVVWENVPGVLSADDGRAFGSLLGGLAELGYGFAYRVLDAQYFGLAQRRARVFVVGCLGDWRRAAAVLFERESLSGHPAPRREAGEDIAYTVGTRAGQGSDDLLNPGGLHLGIPERARALTSSNQRIDYETETLIAHSLRADGFDASEDGTGRGTPIVPINLQVATRHEALGERTGFGLGEDGDPAFTLSKSHMHAVAFTNQCGADNQDVFSTLKADCNGALPMLSTGIQVRRLTPRECERLQGFPDDYTLIPYRGGLAKDGPRYKALGNSMAVPVMRWIGQQIQLVEQL